MKELSPEAIRLVRILIHAERVDILKRLRREPTAQLEEDVKLLDEALNVIEYH